MSVERVASGLIELTGDCTLEDAEILHRQLLEDSESTVDWRACHSAHTAVIQVLLAARPRLLGPPLGGFLRERVELIFDNSTI